MNEESKRIVSIIRRHAHDVRNSINSLDLEAVLLGELSTDPAVAGTLRRMRVELTQLEATVKALQYKFTEPAPLTLTTNDLMDLWQRQIAPLETATRKIEWSASPEAQDITLDAHAILSVMRELVLAAWGRAPASALKAAVVTMDQHVTLELREPISSTPPAAEALEEQQRLVALHGGTLSVSDDVLTGERVISLDFASQLHDKASMKNDE